MAPGAHTLEITVTNTDRGVSATTSASFTVPDHSEAPTGTGPDPAAPAAPEGGFVDGVDGASGSAAAEMSTGPTVMGVYFDSTAWAASFHTYLTNHGYGDAGFLVPGGSSQLLDLPWVNLNRVSIRFSEDVTVAQGDLLVSGSAVTTYGYAASGGFSYNPATFTATWTLDQNIPADKLRLQVRDSVTDAAGDQLDGDWADGADAYGSGDGTAGGNFNFRVNVLPGDVNRSGSVNSNDPIEVRARLFKNTTSPITGTNDYTPFHDVDGSGSILANDYSATNGGAANAPNLPGDDPLPPPDPTVSMDGTPRTHSQYIEDYLGNAVRTRLDTRSGRSGQPLSALTTDPVPGPGALTYTLLNNARNGGVELTPTDGNFTYTPLFDRQGPDHFRYNAQDGAGVSQPADVFIETTREPMYANDDVFVVDRTEPSDSPVWVLENDLGTPIESIDSRSASGGGTTDMGGPSRSTPTASSTTRRRTAA